MTAPSRSRLVTADPRPHCVYEHYDADDVLLYVGCCEDITKRTYDHVGASAWTSFAVRSQGTWYPNLKEARAAETSAIRAGRPVFNLDGYPASHRPNETERRQIRSEYMRSHGYRHRRTKRDAQSSRHLITDELRAMIACGEYAAGARLPSLSQMATRWGVSISAIQHALRSLRTDGLIVATKGKGTFVADPLPAAEIQQGYRDDDPDFTAHLDEAS